jgi:hypothetical protein
MVGVDPAAMKRSICAPSGKTPAIQTQYAATKAPVSTRVRVQPAGLSMRPPIPAQTWMNANHNHVYTVYAETPAVRLVPPVRLRLPFLRSTAVAKLAILGSIVKLISMSAIHIYRVAKTMRRALNLCVPIVWHQVRATLRGPS